jgi:hypothetical protein
MFDHYASVPLIIYQYPTLLFTSHCHTVVYIPCEYSQVSFESRLEIVVNDQSSIVWQCCQMPLFVYSAWPKDIFFLLLTVTSMLM